MRIQLFRKLMIQHHIPGVSIATIDHEKITSYEFGVKDSISREPVTKTTVFEGASLSKPLIAYAALKLCEKGLLSLEGLLSEYPVTLRQVLSHTAGFSSRNAKKGERIQLEFTPGSHFAYSGDSFRYLGYVIETVTGTTLAAHLEESVFSPLNMNESSFVWEERYSELAASPHDRKGNPTEKWKPTRAVASFSLHTTALDFAKFMIGSRQFPQMRESQVHIDESIAWGLGWGLEKGGGAWHSGDNGTFQSFAFQKGERGVVLMTNSANGFKLCREVVRLFDREEHPLIDWEEFETRTEESIDEEFLSSWWKSYDL